MTQLTSPVSFEARKQAILAMQKFLDELPPSKNGPLMQYDEALLSTLEKVLNKLKAFIRFLSKLNPVEYLRWMHDAFAHYIHVPGQETGAQSESISSAPELASASTKLTDGIPSLRKGVKKKRAKKIS